MLWLLPLLSGILFALAQPGYHIYPLSYVFLLPLLFFYRRGSRHPLLAFALFEFSRNVMLLTFIPKVMTHYGGMSGLLGLTGWIGLSLFLAFICAPVGTALQRLLGTGHGWMLIPLLFAGKDALLEIIFGGFPWCLLGYSQIEIPWLMQWAEIGGVHLLTALVILINLLLYRLILLKSRNTLISLLLVVAILFAGGSLLRWRTEKALRGEETITLAVLQPNSSYDNYRGVEPRLSELLEQSAQLVVSGAKAVIWPEYSLPIYPRQWPAYTRRFQDFAAEHAPLIGGFTDRRGPGEVYNAVFLFDGETVQQYNKMRLAPFGEYIPFRSLFFFISRITDEISDFTPGSGPSSLTLLGHKIGLPICFEAIFPGLVRQFVRQGAELLAVTSNDSWYGGGRAHRQLLSMSVLRAVENRRYLLRSTANGISAWVTPLGEVRDEIAYGREGGFLARVRFLSSQTLFSLVGVHFGSLCLLGSFMLIVAPLTKRFRRQKLSDPSR